MRQKLLAGLAMTAVLAMLACGGGGSDYKDAIEVNQAFVNAMESYLDDIDQAENGSNMANAINAYADKIEDLAPRMKAVAQKYPEWKDRAKMPEELKPLTEKAEALGERMGGSFMKAMKYMQDAEVQAAQQRLIKSMTMLQP